MNPLHFIDVAAVDREWETAMNQLTQVLDGYHKRVQATRLAETAAGTGSWTLTLSDRLLSLSPGACVLLAMDEGATFQVSQLLDSVAPECRDRFLADWASVALEGSRLVRVYRMAPAGRDPFSITHHWSVVRDASGVIRQLSGVMLAELETPTTLDPISQP